MMQSDVIIGTDTSDDIIQHFGIKGMKWGFRRSRKPSTRRLKREAKKAQKAWDRKYLSRHTMTTTDLQKATQRLKAENNFAEQVYRSRNIMNGGNNNNNKGNNKSNPLTEVVKSIGNDIIRDQAKTGYKVIQDKVKDHLPEYTKATTKAARALVKVMG